jgi:aspartyl-tRNA synthetase
VAEVWEAKSWAMPVPRPLPRMSWQEAMDKYGCDKPDLRFDLAAAGCL